MSVLSHPVSVNAECQAIIRSETLLKLSKKVSNWFENQTLHGAQHKAVFKNSKLHLLIALEERKQKSLHKKQLKSQSCLVATMSS